MTLRALPRATRSGAGTGRASWMLFPAIVAAALAPEYLQYALIPGAVLYLVLANRLPRLTPTIGIALGLGWWAVLSLQWTVNPQASSSSVKLLGLALTLFVLLADDVARTATWRPAIQMVGVAGAVVSASYILFARPAPYEPSEWLTDELGRLALPFVGVNYSAYAITIGIAATAAVLLQRARRPTRIEWVGWGAALAVDAVALIRTDTRGAQLGAILAVLAASVAARWAWTALKLSFICLVMAAVLSLTNTIASVVEVIDLGDLSVIGHGRGLSGRELLWESALLATADQPFQGYGIDAYYHLLWNGIAAHNLFLSSLLGLGFVGLTLYGALLLRIFWPLRPQQSTTQRLADPDDGARLRAVMVAASVPIWSSGVWEWSPINWTVLGVCAGVAALVGRSSNDADVVTDSHQLPPAEGTAGNNR